MGRPTKPNIKLPEWFDLSKYAGSEELDAADWYLNLTYRLWLKSDPEVSRKLKESAIKELRDSPVIRRDNILGKAASEYRYQKEQGWTIEGPEPTVKETVLSRLSVRRGRDLEDVGLPECFINILNGQPPDMGIWKLSVAELYLFESRIPQPLRQFGREYGDLNKVKKAPEYAPKGYNAALDDAMPQHLLSSFLRVDLSLPNSVLKIHFDKFLKEERASLKQIAPAAPYIPVVVKQIKERNLEKYGKKMLLAFLDLTHWSQEPDGKKLEDAPLSRAFAVSKKDIRDLKRCGASHDDDEVGEEDIRDLKRWSKEINTPFWLDAALLPLVEKVLTKK